MRRVEADGGFATVLATGDPDRGALMLLIADRGAHVACLERQLGADGGYRWQTVGPAAGATDAKSSRFLAKAASIRPGFLGDRTGCRGCGTIHR